MQFDLIIHGLDHRDQRDQSNVFDAVRVTLVLCEIMGGYR